MTYETVKHAEAPTGDGAHRDALSRWNNEGGAQARSQNATETTADTTWFVPPIVVPALLVLIIAVRVLALM
jgi:hypothetical protein